MFSRYIRNEKVVSITQQFKIIFAERGLYFFFSCINHMDLNG